jgi:hypothetical protein
MHLSREREEDRLTGTTRPPEPAPPEAARPGALDWASAMGNQAVARLARQAIDHEDEGAEAEESPEMAALDDIDDLAEDDLTE